jgi:hypothetical protein
MDILVALLGIALYVRLSLRDSCMVRCNRGTVLLTLEFYRSYYSDLNATVVPTSRPSLFVSMITRLFFLRLPSILPHYCPLKMHFRPLFSIPIWDQLQHTYSPYEHLQDWKHAMSRAQSLDFDRRRM